MLPCPSQQDLRSLEEGGGSPARSKDRKGATLPGRSAGGRGRAAGAAGEEGTPLDAQGVTPGLLTLTWLVSARAFRKNFIISKYVEKKYAKRSPAAQCPSLPEAVKNKDVFSLLQAYAENMDLSEPVQAPLQVWHLVDGTIIRGTRQGTSTRGSYRQLVQSGAVGSLSPWSRPK